MKVIATAGALASALILAACMTPTTDRPTVSSAEASGEAQKQAELAVKLRLEERARVAAVAQRLFIANVGLCPETHRSLGLRADVAEEFGPQFRPAAGSLGFSSQPRVDWVAEGGPAEAAGLQSGDQLLSVAGAALVEHTSPDVAIDKALASGKTDAPVKLRYRRDGAEQEVVIAPVRTCAYRVVIVDDDVINAAADGKRIMINRGLIRFLKSDDELALVMAHELAHDTERHMRAKSVNATMGLLGGAVFDVGFAALGVNTGGAFMKAGQAAGAGYASPEFESEADYIGMYYMARAGYDTNGVEDFWRRMSVEQPKSIFVTSSHPANAQRYVAIAKTRDEIVAKQAAHAVLLPERRAGKKLAQPSASAPAAKTT